MLAVTVALAGPTAPDAPSRWPLAAAFAATALLAALLAAAAAGPTVRRDDGTRAGRLTARVHKAAVATAVAGLAGSGATVAATVSYRAAYGEALRETIEGHWDISYVSGWVGGRWTAQIGERRVQCRSDVGETIEVLCERPPPLRT